MSMQGGDIRLALCGDVMLGRGIDQILPHPGEPTPCGTRQFANNAKDYVVMAERRNGALPADRDLDYVWGDALEEFERFGADLRLVNLETSITKSSEPWPAKPIAYRMNPQNVGVLTRAGIDFCALANNHVMDFRYTGLGETIAALANAGVAFAGAGRNRREAAAPAILPIAGKGRVIVSSLTMLSGHAPVQWAAGGERPGVNYIHPTDRGLAQVLESVAGLKRPGDVLIASIHSGNNFGYAVHPLERSFLQRLVDVAKFDLIHCHSPHHPKAVEVHDGAPILYGTGDLINDYEGLPSTPQHEFFRPDLGTIALAEFSPASGACTLLRMRPTREHRMRVRRASLDDAAELCAIFNRESAAFGTRILNEDGLLAVDLTRGA